MSDIQFNNQGVPLIGYGRSFIATTKGSPKNASQSSDDQRPAVTKQTEKVEDKISVKGKSIVAWGTNNDFPKTAYETVRSVDVLNTGLKFIRNLTLGQGIFPCRVKEYDDAGNEILEIINDKDTINFCRSRMVRRYLEKATRDYLKFGVANVQLVPNTDFSKMVGINTINSMFCRYGEADKGIINFAAVSGKWPDNPGENEAEAFYVLDEYDPIADLTRLKLGGKKNKNIIFPIRDSWSNSEYYSEPIWLSAYLAGWIDIAKTVPTFLKKAYTNQITWKWHIQIPYAFWDKKFPKEDFETIPARQQAIETFMDTIEENLCGSENADKPIFTFFEINPQNGKAEEQWVITPLDNKYKENDKLFTSAAANSEILFSLMINPNVMGAGMPGGSYAGNQGGSNIREAFLVNIANSWIDRQNILDPLEAYLEFNGKKDMELRFRQTILTTLDTGAGTKKTLS